MRNFNEIRTLDELKKSCLDKKNEYFIALSANFISRKFIEYNLEDDSWFVIHCIDDYEANYASTDDLINNEEDRIVRAINENRFFVEWYTS